MVTTTTRLGARTLRAELDDIVRPAAPRLTEHPYYRYLRDGSLPPAVFAHHALQDSLYLLPRYGRTYARSAAAARDQRHAQFLAHLAVICLDNSASDTEGFGPTAQRLGMPAEFTAERPPIAPTTLSYTSFLTAASVTSFAAGVGALLPSAWLQMLVTDDLLERHVAGSRYAELIRTTHPGDEYRQLVATFLDLVDEVGAACSPDERAELVRHVRYAVRYEWMFVEASWRLESWPLVDHAPPARISAM